jgi:hypothetical protein
MEQNETFRAREGNPLQSATFKGMHLRLLVEFIGDTLARILFKVSMRRP